MVFKLFWVMAVLLVRSTRKSIASLFGVGIEVDVGFGSEGTGVEG